MVEFKLLCFRSCGFARFFIFNTIKMAISREKKEEVVKELQEKLKTAKSSIFFDYTGVNVKKTMELKKKLKEVGGEFFVAKKKLINIALKENNVEDFSTINHKGSCAVIFSNEDEVSGVKSLYTFVKEYLKKNKASNINVMGGFYEGKVISKEEVDNLSKVLGRSEFLSKFMFMLQYPASGIARTISAINDKKNTNTEVKEVTPAVAEAVVEAPAETVVEAPAEVAA